jgi:hypothetical protein
LRWWDRGVGGIVVLLGGFILMREAAVLFPKPVPELSREQIKEAMEKAGGDELLGKEAREAILRFGGDDRSNDHKLTNYVAISKMASLIGGIIVGMWPIDEEVPAHIKIRRGSHFDYQFVYIFGTGLAPTSSSEKLIPVDGSVYLRNTAEEAKKVRR